MALSKTAELACQEIDFITAKLTSATITPKESETIRIAIYRLERAVFRATKPGESEGAD